MTDEPKDILDRLSKLKSGDASIESKMSSRAENQKQDGHEKIEIPVAKRFSVQQAQANEPPLSKPGFMKDTLSPHSMHQNGPLSEVGKEKTPAIKQDDSIFGGAGISRKTLKREMVTDPEIKKAARLTRLGLSSAERVGLVKEVFAPALGGNISKTDLKSGIKRLNRKMLGAKDAETHAKIRKEIKFFKKIGGI
jgi:hypothetical protein